MKNLFKSYHVETDGNALQVCRSILDLFDVKYTSWKIKKDVAAHIEGHSLLAIKDVLSNYNLESVAIRKGNYSYNDFETPFICAIQEEDWPQAYFTVVHDCDEEHISYVNPSKNNIQSCSLQDFEKIDKEIILLLDSEKKINEIDYLANKEKENKERLSANLPVYVFLILLFGSLILQITADSGLNWLSLVFLITSAIGFLISFMLVWHEVDAHNPFIKEVCGGVGRKVNCNAVLSSKGSRFFGINWSVWGFSYFLTFLISQVIFVGQPTYTALWSAVSLIAMLYIPYSIYYQSRVVRQWCPLCLAVQGILLLNGIFSAMSVYNGNSLQNLNYSTVFPVLFLSIVSLLSVYYAVPLLKKAQDSDNYEKRWKKLRFHPDVFQSLLSKTTSISYPTEGLGIVLGDPGAKNEIIKVCNPYCGPCSKAHPELENIVRNNSDVKIRVIFTADGSDEDIRTAPVSHLMAVQEKYGHHVAQKAMDDWYLSTDKDYKVFAEKYPMNGELKRQSEKLFAMRDWCKAMKIRATPTIFINGQELPDSYRIAEIKNFF